MGLMIIIIPFTVLCTIIAFPDPIIEAAFNICRIVRLFLTSCTSKILYSIVGANSVNMVYCRLI